MIGLGSDGSIYFGLAALISRKLRNRVVLFFHYRVGIVVLNQLLLTKMHVQTLLHFEYFSA
jgi:hypothetical protein